MRKLVQSISRSGPTPSNRLRMTWCASGRNYARYSDALSDNSDVKRTDRTADISGGSLFTFKMVNTFVDKTKCTRRYRAAGEVALTVVTLFERVSQFVGAVVNTSVDCHLEWNVCSTIFNVRIFMQLFQVSH